MSAAVLERMFEPFFTTKEVGKGTGLGLSTAHAIVHAHGGFIHVYSELGKGTRFKVYLPAERTEETSGARAARPIEPPKGHGETILLVDDEAIIRDAAQRMLERSGYRVLLASNGAEAIAAFVAHRQEIAVVITDMAMPVMDGAATMVALRALDPRIPIVGSSGLSANGAASRPAGAETPYFVLKPYTAEALLQLLERVLAESGSPFRA
jgi:CheY-like chemotaxis protein